MQLKLIRKVHQTLITLTFWAFQNNDNICVLTKDSLEMSAVIRFTRRYPPSLSTSGVKIQCLTKTKCLLTVFLGFGFVRLWRETTWVCCFSTDWSRKELRHKPVAQSCAVAVEVKHSGGPLQNQTWLTNGWSQKKLSKFNFCTHTTALWPMEQSSILSAKFDCPVARQDFSLLPTAHDCETGPFSCLFSENNWSGGGSHSVSVESVWHPD